jgi:hypothetical protein
LAAIAVGVTGKRLDLDNLRAEVGQHGGGSGAGDVACAVDNFQVFEQSFGHAGSSATMNSLDSRLSQSTSFGGV